MSASSRSGVSLTTSAAVTSAEGSMRMSSAASAAYEKPRSGRSSCMDETPRSRRMASAWTPFEDSCSSTCENSPCRRRTFADVERRNRSKYGATVGSRSIAISLPSPRRRAASNVEWPPAPNVQSTIVSPGRGASAASTSSARTGTWSVSVGKTLGNIFRAPFDGLPLLAPDGAIPDLEVVIDAGDRHLAVDPRAREQRRRNHDPSLLVEVGLGRGGEEVTLHHPRLAAERVEAADALGQPGPLRTVVHVETTVEALGDDDGVTELLAVPRGQGEPVLVVQGVLVLAQQHRSPSPISPHFNPLCPSCKPGAERGVERIPPAEGEGEGGGKGVAGAVGVHDRGRRRRRLVTAPVRRAPTHSLRAHDERHVEAAGIPLAGIG